MNRLRSIVKSVVGEALLRTGVWERTLRRWARRGEAIVLTYHRVIEKWDRTLEYSQPGMVVTAETFDRQLHFLKKYFEIVPLSSLILDFEFRISKCSDFRGAQSSNPQSAIRNPQSSALNSRLSTLRPLCALTFDDGWRDNYEIAFPILRQHGLPATIFLTTDYIGTDLTFWHTELMYLLMHGDVSRYRLLQYVLQAYPSAVSHRWRQLVRSGGIPTAYDLDPLIEAVKATCGEDEIDNLIRDVKHALGISGSLLSQRRFFLDWDQVREMADAGMEIGSHGCSHRILTRLGTEEAEEELIRSKADIERHVGKDVLHLAFPEGASNRGLIALAAKAGYRTVSLCRSAVPGNHVQPLALLRMGLHEAVSAGRNGAFSGAPLCLWLSRAPGAMPV